MQQLPINSGATVVGRSRSVQRTVGSSFAAKSTGRRRFLRNSAVSGACLKMRSACQVRLPEGCVRSGSLRCLRRLFGCGSTASQLIRKAFLARRLMEASVNSAGECASHTVLVIEQAGSFRGRRKESRSLSSMEPLARSSKLERIRRTGFNARMQRTTTSMRLVWAARREGKRQAQTEQ